MSAVAPTRRRIGGPASLVKRGAGRRRRLLLLAPLVPGILFLIAFSIYPTIYSLIISFYRWNLNDPLGKQWGGFHNYEILVKDPAFWHSVVVTIKYVATTVVLEFALGLGLALLFFRRFPGDRFLRALLILPMVVAPVVVGLLWRYMLGVQFGVINYLISLIGLGRVDFLGDTGWALPTLVLVDIWQWTPFIFLIMLAALQGIPEDILEAARIDGAKPTRIFFDHMLPLLRYPIAVAVGLRLIDAFRVYDFIFMTTRGGPIDKTQTMSWQIYDAGFATFDIGYAAAFSWLLLILVVVVTTVFLRLMLRKEDLA
ncbi:MAG: transporter permease protein [Conexibacter sp.]|jgi:multiple sugar transport system permease protein|nr:transporter permease protein [Conexibacter sp.]